MYAIKVLRKTDLFLKNQQDTIMTERNAMARTNHPFIVQLYFAFQSKSYLYLVMEYLIGGDLASFLSKRKYLDEPMVQRYIAEVVLALEYLHSVNIIHRDLKPDNLLINFDGHLKMTDFGLSKMGIWGSGMDTPNPLRDFASSNNSHTSDDDRIIGTPDYLSPEILIGLGHGFPVDWWALGVMTFELLVGLPPFFDDTPEKIFQNILSRDMFEWPATINVSDAAKDFVDKLLTIDAKRRLGTKGVHEIKSHPFFSGINWDTVLTSPMDDFYIPKVPIITDDSKSKPKPDSDIFNTTVSSPEDGNPDLNIPGFSFININHLKEKNYALLNTNTTEEFSSDYHLEFTDDSSE
uniref:non-specific serine/threonine protein kinase n=1 Tax=Arcella intermedia TaxID=1963864 RepID=A0A6B2L736_9EUKA